MTFTRTHTVFFDEDSLAPLREQIAALEENFEKRKPYMDADVVMRYEGRFKVLNAAADLLAEPAD